MECHIKPNKVLNQYFKNRDTLEILHFLQQQIQSLLICQKDLTLQSSLKGILKHYRTLQVAWNDNDFSKIQEYVTPELFNELKQERANYAGAQHTEVLYVDAELVRAERKINFQPRSVSYLKVAIVILLKELKKIYMRCGIWNVICPLQIHHG